MKTRSAPMLLALLLTAGCSDQRSPGDAANPANAPTDYLQNAVQAETRAIKTVDATAVNKAIDTFYIQEGRFPKDLGELVEKSFLPLLPTLPTGMTWEYDTNNGIAKIKKG